jgi:hypothetical protein
LSTRTRANSQPRARRGLLGLRLGGDDKQIVRLAVPALGALAAEPLYVLVDTAIVGPLGVDPLAALALAPRLRARSVSATSSPTAAHQRWDVYTPPA